MSDLVLVKFITNNSPYQGGETAGFSLKLAAKLVAAKKAVYCDADGNPLKPKPPKEETKKERKAREKAEKKAAEEAEKKAAEEAEAAAKAAEEEAEASGG
jgi:hypothetical protein